MPIIKQLDSDTINKIAAGEVIERPAAVVKELVENAIDAKANSITIEIKEGGISLIRITDNGHGIEKDDLDLAFTRHSTSKIRNATDLITVMSLGFRGEALSSIAAIAQVETITKTPGSLLGSRYVIEGGEKKTCEEIGCPEGTTFIVRNLFYNTPVRRKFLKSPQTEAGYVSNIIEKIAAAHPEVAFKFIVNGQIKILTSGNSNLKDIIYTIYGRDIVANSLEVNAKSQNISMKGYIAKPIVSRGNRNYELYFINGRSIKSPLIAKAIEDAYKSYTMQHRYPFVVLSLTINPELIDVNVHPTKMEVRFTNEQELYNFIYNEIKDTLSGKNLIQQVSIDNNKDRNNTSITKNTNHQTVSSYKKDILPEPFEVKRLEKLIDDALVNFEKETINAVTDDVTIDSKDTDAEKETVTDAADNVTIDSKNTDVKKENGNIVSDVGPMYKAKEQQNTNTQLSLFDSPNYVKGNKANNFNIIGQIFLTYWIVECNDNMYIIDQHAAHEKVLFEKMMENLKNRVPNSQMISPPIIITLNMHQENILNKHMSTFVSLGYEIEHFGGNEYQVRAVPSDIPGVANTNLLIEIIDELSDSDKEADNEIILNKVASLSCKAAIKGNNHISLLEAKELISQLMSLENPFNCPHGRPTIISMTKYDIEKKFKRVI